MRRPLLVGETNPLSSFPRDALWPSPEGCSGWRLCHSILGISAIEYLGMFDRVNLCRGRWSMLEARRSVTQILRDRPEGVIVLLGRRVRAAFGADFGESVDRVGRLLLLPHPSGRCREWNDPSVVEAARLALLEAARE